jgi:hypothetical protein
MWDHGQNDSYAAYSKYYSGNAPRKAGQRGVLEFELLHI